MDRLASALERLEEHLRREGATVMDLARPGIDAAELDEILSPLGLAAHADLRTWFGWHDGAGERLVTPYAQSVLAPGCEFWPAELMAAGGYSASRGCWSVVRALTLDEAVGAHGHRAVAQAVLQCFHEGLQVGPPDPVPVLG